MKVRISDGAEFDFEHMADGIATIDPALAEATASRVKAAAAEIGRPPHHFAPVAGRVNLRKRRMPPYLILFSIEDDHILILRIVHERSDWMALV